MIRVAAMFPLQGRGFTNAYRSATHALHLHDYAGTIRLDGRDFALTPGTLTLSPANGESQYDLPRPGLHWCVHFNPASTDGGPTIELPLVRTLGARTPEAVARLARVSSLHQLSQRPDAHPAARSAAAIAMAELLHWVGLLDSLSPGGQNPSQRAIERATDHIDRNLHRQHSAASLARTIGLSQNYLARLFHQRTKMTVARYTLSRRIDLAKLLLRSTQLSIKEIAIRVGLPDAQHFNKAFRSMTSLSPSAYREESAGSI